MHLRNIISIGLLFASLVGSSGAWAVDCPQNSYSFTTQAQVDAFPQNCDSVLDRLTVANSTDITNIDALANLTSLSDSVGGDLYIYGNAALTNIDGLANLTSVGDELYIANNTALINFDGLANLTSMGGNLSIYTNAALTNLRGLAKLTSVGGFLDIYENDLLTNLEGLANLTSVGGLLYITDNTALTNCQGLAPVLGWPSGPPADSVGGEIDIVRNATGCNSVEEILASYSLFDDGGFSYDVINATDVEMTGRALGNTDADIVIPDTAVDGTTRYSVKTIGYEAFMHNDLTSVTIPDSVTTIGEHAFKGNDLNSVTIPNSVKSIGKFAFEDAGLTSVTIGESVETIGYQAFVTNSLESLTIPDSVKTIGALAFAYNSLTSVTIGNSVETIGDYAFRDNNLTSVIIGESVETIGYAAFTWNDLTSVTISNSVRSIGNEVFADNDLKSVTIGNSVETIGDYAFAVNELTSVTIPDSVTSIGRGAFFINTLNSAAFLGNFGTFNLDMFGNNTNLATITYGLGATGWDNTQRTFTPRTGPTGSITATPAPAITLIIPDDISINAVGYLTNVDIGMATASDRDGNITVTSSRLGPFQSGFHKIVWTATDSVGSIETATQIIKVHPLANFCANEMTAEGSNPEAHVRLSGHAAVYPVMIPFELSGTATYGDDYTVTQSGSLTIEEGTVGTINLSIVADGDVESEETVQIILGESVNAALGVASAQTWLIVEGNLPPKAKMMITQDGVTGNTLVLDGGTVTVSVIITDANDGDQHTVDWLDALTLPNAVVDVPGQSLSFSVAQQGPITLLVDVSDGKESITVSSLAVVQATAPILALDADTDGDGLSDAVEGYGDSDGDGIPDYQDNIEASNVVPMENGFMQTEACMLVSLGAASLVMGDNNVTVSESELVSLGMAVDSGYDYPSDLVDFAVTGAGLGHSYKVVMPLSQPVPNGAVYRKYLGENIGWQMFVENAYNALATTSAIDGACPEAGSERYTPGLTTSDNCLQLLMQDGGPNDTDGAVDGTTSDTGGIAVKYIGTPSNNSEVVVQQTVITADGVDSTVVTVTVYDDQGLGLEHMLVSASMAISGVVVSDFVEQGSGVYTATVAAGMTAGSGPVTVVIDNGEMSVMLVSARLRLASVSVAKSGGGGCTVASDGSTDASLLLLLIMVGLLLARRRYHS